MTAYEDFAYIYHQGPYPTFSLRVAEHLPSVLEKFDFHPKTLLDLACGEGSFAIQMALAGMDVTGVDRSADMLQLARLKSAAQSLHIDWIEEDIRNLDFPPAFDLITCLFDSLNYLLEPDDLLNTFQSVQRALKPLGFFIFDMNTLYGLAVLWQRAGSYVQQDTEEIFEVHRPSFDYEKSIATVKITAFLKEDPSWRRIEETHQERAYPVEQIRSMVEESGLEILGCYGSLSDLGDLAPESGRVWMIARKSEGFEIERKIKPPIKKRSVRRR